jgi:hypothetical protein
MQILVFIDRDGRPMGAVTAPDEVLVDQDSGSLEDEGFHGSFYAFELVNCPTWADVLTSRQALSKPALPR